MTFHLSAPLDPRRVRELLSHALFLADTILDVAGDGSVPGGQFFETVPYGDASRKDLVIDIISKIGDGMTYGIVKDTLTGLWYGMVTHRSAYLGVIEVSHGDLGRVASGIIHKSILPRATTVG